jgi:mono/diheme cytochrome c family protein
MRFAATLLLLLAPALPALAQPRTGEAAEGRTLAAQWCAACHRVAPEGPGPATDAVPGFAALARRPGVTAEGLVTFLGTPHAGMPDYRLTLRQAQDLAAHILSLRP